LSAELTKTHSFRLLFLAIFPTGKGIFTSNHTNLCIPFQQFSTW